MPSRLSSPTKDDTIESLNSRCLSLKRQNERMKRQLRQKEKDIQELVRFFEQQSRTESVIQNCNNKVFAKATKSTQKKTKSFNKQVQKSLEIYNFTKLKIASNQTNEPFKSKISFTATAIATQTIDKLGFASLDLLAFATKETNKVEIAERMIGELKQELSLVKSENKLLYNKNHFSMKQNKNSLETFETAKNESKLNSFKQRLGDRDKINSLNLQNEDFKEKLKAMQCVLIRQKMKLTEVTKQLKEISKPRKMIEEVLLSCLNKARLQKLKNAHSFCSSSGGIHIDHEGFINSVLERLLEKKTLNDEKELTQWLNSLEDVMQPLNKPKLLENLSMTTYSQELEVLPSVHKCFLTE